MRGKEKGDVRPQRIWRELASGFQLMDQRLRIGFALAVFRPGLKQL